MLFTRSTCPQIPGYESLDHPRWLLTAARFTVDAEWNTRPPFGFCIMVKAGPVLSLTVDVNPPFGEPNRVYLNGPRRAHMIGLCAWHEYRDSGEQIGGTPVMRNARCRPHLIRGQRHNWATGQAWDWQDPAAWRWWVTHPARNRAT